MAGCKRRCQKGVDLSLRPSFAAKGTRTVCRSAAATHCTYVSCRDRESYMYANASLTLFVNLPFCLVSDRQRHFTQQRDGREEPGRNGYSGSFLVQPAPSRIDCTRDPRGYERLGEVATVARCFLRCIPDRKGCFSSTELINYYFLLFFSDAFVDMSSHPPELDKHHPSRLGQNPLDISRPFGVLA